MGNWQEHVVAKHRGRIIVRDIALDEIKDLASLIILAKDPRSSVKPGLFKVLQQRVHRWRPLAGYAVHRVARTFDGRDVATQRLFTDRLPS